MAAKLQLFSVTPLFSTKKNIRQVSICQRSRKPNTKRKLALAMLTSVTTRPFKQA